MALKYIFSQLGLWIVDTYTFCLLFILFSPVWIRTTTRCLHNLRRTRKIWELFYSPTKIMNLFNNFLFFNDSLLGTVYLLKKTSFSLVFSYCCVNFVFLEMRNVSSYTVVSVLSFSNISCFLLQKAALICLV